MRDENAVVGHDLRPFENLTDEEVAWMRDLQRGVSAGDLLIRVGAGDREHDPVVRCAEDGRWWAGRYVGLLSFRDRKLVIKPRLGMDVLAHWLAAANRLSLTETSASQRQDDLFLPALLAHVWSQSVVHAARHGLPYLRVDATHVGPFVRGRLDVRATARLLPRRQQQVASRERERTLDHDLTSVLIAAEWSLNRALGGTHWQNPRVADLLGPLRNAVGSRPRVPTASDLGKVRYTPIRLPWRAVAELSRRIATNQGLIPTADSHEATGILVDVAELWELFVLEALRRAAPHVLIRHGTTEVDRGPSHLLQSIRTPDVGLGRLLPDYLIEEEGTGRVVAVLDAKYKNLAPRPDRPTGVARGDLYQLAAYLSRFGAGGQSVRGALVYPHWGDQDSPTSAAETSGPWRTAAADSTVQFVRCPIRLKQAVPFLAELTEAV